VCHAWVSPGTGLADDPVKFSDYHADFSVDANGLMNAVETITAEFPDVPGAAMSSVSR
jgi:hypothetical protein